MVFWDNITFLKYYVNYLFFFVEFVFEGGYNECSVFLREVNFFIYDTSTVRISYTELSNTKCELPYLVVLLLSKVRLFLSSFSYLFGVFSMEWDNSRPCNDCMWFLLLLLLLTSRVDNYLSNKNEPFVFYKFVTTKGFCCTPRDGCWVLYSFLYATRKWHALTYGKYEIFLEINCVELRRSTQNLDVFSGELFGCLVMCIICRPLCFIL